MNISSDVIKSLDAAVDARAMLASRKAELRQAIQMRAVQAFSAARAKRTGFNVLAPDEYSSLLAASAKMLDAAEVHMISTATKHGRVDDTLAFIVRSLELSLDGLSDLLGGELTDADARSYAKAVHAQELKAVGIPSAQQLEYAGKSTAIDFYEAVARHEGKSHSHYPAKRGKR